MFKPCSSCCTVINKVTFRLTDKNFMNLNIFRFCSYIILQNCSTMKVLINITVR